MSTDWITRILLAGILLCLALLVIQGLRADSQLGRYQVEILAGRRGGATILRVDTRTGRSWRLDGYPDAPSWTALPEPEAEGADE